MFHPNRVDLLRLAAAVTLLLSPLCCELLSEGRLDLLLTTHYSLLSTHYLLLTTYYLLLTTYSVLLTTSSTELSRAVLCWVAPCRIVLPRTLQVVRNGMFLPLTPHPIPPFPTNTPLNPTPNCIPPHPCHASQRVWNDVMRPRYPGAWYELPDNASSQPLLNTPQGTFVR